MNDYPRPAPGPSDPSDDEALRRLLEDAVADVEPRESLGLIRSRIAESGGSRRPWLWGAGAAVVATAATVAAVAVLADGPGTEQSGPPVAGSPSASPTPSAEPSPEPSPQESPQESPGGATATETEDADPAVQMTVPAYYVGETSRGLRLYREFHRATAPESQKARAAVGAALGAPEDPDYRSDWPAGTDARAVRYDGDVITVDLESPPEGLRQAPRGMSEEQAAMALEQLIYTAQAAVQEGRPGVQFLVDGERTDMLLGRPAAEPLAQGDEMDVLAGVWIITPAEGQQVSSPFEVSGVANAFEANVQWELMRGDEVVRSGFTMAEEAFTRAPYSVTVKAPPGEYTLVVHDTDPSGGEGFAPWEDTKNITVR